MSKKIMQVERTVLTTGALTEAGANASAVEAARRRQAAKRMVGISNGLIIIWRWCVT